jgi:hypothetical protein
VRLIEHLGLGRDRVIIVPGNHDINRKSSEAYFNTCDADGETPRPPFWPKWKQYSQFLQEFYPTFRTSRPQFLRISCRPFAGMTERADPL